MQRPKRNLIELLSLEHTVRPNQPFDRPRTRVTFACVARACASGERWRFCSRRSIPSLGRPRFLPFRVDFLEGTVAESSKRTEALRAARALGWRSEV